MGANGLLLFALVYLGLLYFTARAANSGLIPVKVSHSSWVYVLSLGIYCGVWALFTTFGFAASNGYSFLAYYLGVTGIFLLAPIMLSPILRLTRAYQLHSLADLFAYRFHSQLAGSLTTMMMVFIMLPLLIAQYQALKISVDLINGDAWLAPTIWLLMGGFSILLVPKFDQQQREQHLGMVMAMAVSSAFKLVAVLGLGAFAVYAVLDGPQALSSWLEANPQRLRALYTPLSQGSWHSFIGAFFISAIAMPYMYTMTFSANHNPRALMTASWGFPLYLLLIALPVPFVVWAAQQSGLAEYGDYLGLMLAVESRQVWVLLLFAVAGFSAALGISVVTSFALASMGLKHWLVPIVSFQDQGNIYNWLQVARRFLIAAVFIVAVVFYQWWPEQDLLALTTMAFMFSLQFVPGLIGVLYWLPANRTGFVVGLMTGMLVLAVCWWLPLVEWLFSLLPALTHTFEGMPHWFVAALLALAVNALAFFLASVLTSRKLSEYKAAVICVNDSLIKPYRWEMTVHHVKDFMDALAPALGQRAAEREVSLALSNLGLNEQERRPYALRRVRDQLENNLSALLGPNVAFDIIEQALPYHVTDEGPGQEDSQFFESRLEDYQHKMSGLAAELDGLRRFHRQTLQDLPLGVCTLSRQQEVLAWNAALEEKTGVEIEQAVGASVDDLPAPWRQLICDFVEADATYLYQQAVRLESEERWFNLHKAILSPDDSMPGEGALVIVFEDVTELHDLHNQLAHSDRLASLGRFSAGIAHEVGNPLTGIACLAQDMQSADRQEDVADYSQQILQQTERINRIVQSLMHYSHGGSSIIAKQSTELFPIVEDAISLVRLSRKGRQYRFINRCSKLLIVDADETRLLQALVNLLANAKDASSEDEVIEVAATQYPDQVEIRVMDQGCGIAKELQSRIFEPFVTTKDPGEGTGLGLAMVYSIISEHGGKIDLQSPTQEGGRGTCFLIRLPKKPDVE